MNLTRILILSCIAGLLFSSALFLGQDFKLHTKVDLVVVPVSVRDQNGSLVPNLKQDDFTILEDSKPQTIVNFSTDPQPLSAAIVVDTGMGGGELRRLSLVAGTLMRQFKESDEVALYRYDHLVTKLSEFTNNSQDLAKGFDTIRQIAESKQKDDEVGMAMGPSALRWLLERTQIGSVGAPPNTGAPPTTPAPPPSTTRPAPVSKVLHDAVFTAVLDLEKRPNHRRKIVVLISDGQVAGSNEHAQPETTTRVLRDGIQLYAVGTDLKLFEHLTVLNSYARSSGGAFFDGGHEESMAASFGQLVDQARDEYVLGYVSNNEVSGTRPVLRKIEVKVPELKVKVTHRPAYLQYP